MRDATEPGIGGSDIGAIIGLDERRDAFAVWAELMGEYTSPPPTPRMKNAKYFEAPLIEQVYPDFTGRNSRYFDRTIRSDRFAFMRATPDGFCTDEARGIEAKFVSWDQYHIWEASPDGIPSGYQLQCHWYMAALDYPRWDLISIRGIDEPDVHTFERDMELEGAMLDVAAKFWTDYVIGGKRPPIGTSDAAGEYLRKRFPRVRTALRKADEHESGLLDLYAQTRSEERQIGKERERIENELKLALGDAEGLFWERGKFTYRNVKDSHVTDWKALASRLMGSYTDEEREAVMREFTELKAGVRRIHFICKEG